MKKLLMMSLLSIGTAVSLHAYALMVPGSLSASFVHSAVGGGRIIRESGRVLINRSRAFVADIYRPSRQKVCNLNANVQWIDRASRRVIRYDVGSLLDLMQILKVARHYKGNLYKSNYHGFHFILTVNAKGQVNKMTFTDKLGMRNTVRFSSIRYNKSPLAASKFRCSVPRGYRVMRGKI